jgi:hypothetical protein
MVGGPVVGSLLITLRLGARNSAEVSVRQRNRVCLARIEDEVRRAIGSTLIVDAYGKALRFQPEAGFGSGGVVPGELIEYAVEPLPSNAPVVSAADGGADRAALVRSDVTRGTRVVLAENLSFSESGFAFDGTTVRVALSNTAPVGREGAPVRVAHQLRIHPRN